MVWFRVDDKLHSHVKAMRAGAEAMGLWVLAGSWATDQLTDGWVPSYVASRLTPHADEYAGRLVAAGLWMEDERDGEKGWQFHQWVEWGQRTKELTMNARADQRDRVARWRERQRQKSGVDDHVEATNGRVTRYTDVSNAPVTEPPSPSPSPSPSSSGDVPAEGKETLPRKTSRGASRGTRLPDDFVATPEMVEWAGVHAPHVNGRLETEQFCDYWLAKAGRDAVKVDWVRTWHSWMRKAEQQAPRSTGRPRAPNTDDKIRRLEAMKDDLPKEIT